MDTSLRLISKLKLGENKEKGTSHTEIVLFLENPIPVWTWPFAFSKDIVNLITGGYLPTDKVGISLNFERCPVAPGCLPLMPVSHFTPETFDDFMDLTFMGVDILYGPIRINVLHVGVPNTDTT